MNDTEPIELGKLCNRTICNYAIFGANGGIGSELSRRLVGEGHRVTLLGRNETELRRLSDEVDAQFETVDASSIAETEECLARVAESTGQLDGVVNCVGSLLLKPAHLTTPDEWAATIAANLTSAFAVVRGAVPVMRKDGGSIVLISSAAARMGLPNHEAIAAAKRGVIGLTQSAAATYAARNIRVKPDVCDYLAGLHRAGRFRDVVIAPIGFISDHLEVLYDLDMEARQLCDELGLDDPKRREWRRHQRPSRCRRAISSSPCRNS